MLKKRKILLCVFSIIVLLIVGVVGFAGNYLVDYALAVDENKMLGSMSGPYTGVQETQAQDEYDEWVLTQDLEEWTLTNDEGLNLWAQYYPAKQPNGITVLAVHGYTVDHRDIAPAIKPFVEAGYHVLAIDQRGRGNSEGDYLGMGWLEKEDVIEWIDEIETRNPQDKILLYGESMGAATVMMTAAQPLSDKVFAVIEDCGYTSAYEMFADQLKERFSLPAFPFLPAAQLVGQVRAGYNFKNASPINELKNATLPILFIHGGADDYVPTWMGQELYDSYTHQKELLIVPNAGHGGSADVDPDLYYKTVFNFIEGLN